MLSFSLVKWAWISTRMPAFCIPRGPASVLNKNPTWFFYCEVSKKFESRFFFFFETLMDRSFCTKQWGPLNRFFLEFVNISLGQTSSRKDNMVWDRNRFSHCVHNDGFDRKQHRQLLQGKLIVLRVTLIHAMQLLTSHKEKRKCIESCYLESPQFRWV